MDATASRIAVDVSSVPVVKLDPGDDSARTAA